MSLTVSGAPRAGAETPPAAHELAVDPTAWHVVGSRSGPDDYYVVMHDTSSSPSAFIRSRYRPPEATTVLGFEVPDADRVAVRTVRWKWRAITLPVQGNECAEGKQDSAAVVYLTYKRALRWYTLKYVWSAVGPRGATCDRKRGVLLAQDTVILESGPPLGAWKDERIDLEAEFRAHFEDGRADADVPPFVGIGLMSDGDQTRTESSADFGDFALSW
jgi:Protein of unknown function (DUF3047)